MRIIRGKFLFGNRRFLPVRGHWLSLVLALTFGLGVRADSLWTGGGDGRSWSDADNWSPTGVPASGAVSIPATAEVVVDGVAEVQQLNALERIEIAGVLCISNLADSVALTVPLVGTGTLMHRNQAGKGEGYLAKYGHPLELAGDNSGFTGVFVSTNAGLCVSHANALGGKNGGPVRLDLKDNQRFVLLKNRTYYNELFIKGNSYAKSYFIAYEGGRWEGDVHVLGGISFSGNTSQFTLTVAGDVSIEANAEIYYSYGGKVQFLGGFSNPNSSSCYGTPVDLGGEAKGKSMGRWYFSGVVKCLAPDLFADNYGYWMVFDINSKYGKLDLNGHHQNLAVLGRTATLTSESPATLTVKDYVRNDYTANTMGINWNDQLQGRVSLELDSSHNYSITLGNMTGSTRGGLLVRCGTLTIRDDKTAFSNLTELVAYNTGTMNVNSASVNPEGGLEALSVANTATMTFKDDMVQLTKRAHLASTAKLKIGAGSYVKVSKCTSLDGRILAAGTYGKVGGTYADGSPIPAQFQLACLTGDGWLETKSSVGTCVYLR